jgi:hypothetical protein
MVRYFEVSCFRAALETAWSRDFLQAHTSVTGSDQRRFGLVSKRGTPRKEVIGEAFRSARPAITLWKVAKIASGSFPSGSFFGNLSFHLQKPASYVHIFKNRIYLDSKIGSMLVRSAGERKSNSKINVAVRVGEVASCLDRVGVSLQ